MIIREKQTRLVEVVEIKTEKNIFNKTIKMLVRIKGFLFCYELQTELKTSKNEMEKMVEDFLLSDFPIKPIKKSEMKTNNRLEIMKFKGDYNTESVERYLRRN